MRDFNHALHIIDILFKYFPEFETFRLFDIINQSELSISDKNIAHDNDAIEIMLVDRLKYAEYVGTTKLTLKLTQLGRQIKESGGHFTYLKRLSEKTILDKERQERKDKSDKLDLHLKQWQVRTKRLPYIVSILALLISVISYFKPETKQIDLQQLQQKLQKIQEHLNKQDSLSRMDTVFKHR